MLKIFTPSETLALRLTQVVDARERRLRRTCLWTILILLFVGEFGISWDSQWHALVGRDSFWTPPHILIYFAVGGTGLVALFLVLADTWRYYQKVPGVHEQSTISILRIFHAPLGFATIGWGALICLIAAPFDNYWHELYGIDITLWSPFHLMGSVGAILAAIGLVFAFASEVIIDRRSECLPKTMFKLTALEWGALLMLGALQRLALTSLAQFHSFSIGPVEFLTYPLPLVLDVGMSAVSTLWFTGRSGTATLLGLLACLHTLLTEAFVPWSLRLLVTHYRFSDRLPFFNAPATLLSLIFVASGLLLDIGFAYVYKRRFWQRSNQTLAFPGRIGLIFGFASAIIIVITAPLILLTTTSLLPAHTSYMPTQTVHPWLDALPLALLLGTIGGWLGVQIGEVLAKNRR